MQDGLKSHGKGVAEVLVDPHRFRVDTLENTRPQVFVATNAKPTLNDVHVMFVLKVLGILRKNGLEPVNVDISIGKSLTEEVERLLAVSPLLVSIFLPEENLKMSAKRDGAVLYAPSEFTVFEESWMCANRRECVLRLRHHLVFRPRYLGDAVELEFRDRCNEPILEAFEARLLRKVQEQAYLDAVTRCSEGGTVAPQWKNRNLEEFLDPKGRLRRKITAARRPRQESVDSGKRSRRRVTPRPPREARPE